MMDSENICYADFFKGLLGKAFEKDQAKINRYA